MTRRAGNLSAYCHVKLPSVFKVVWTLLISNGQRDIMRVRYMIHREAMREGLKRTTRKYIRTRSFDKTREVIDGDSRLHFDDEEER